MLLEKAREMGNKAAKPYAIDQMALTDALEVPYGARQN